MDIFYFSGTGNSCYTAQKIAEGINAESINSIAAFGAGDIINIKRDGCVIVSPLYFYGIPDVVVEFLKKLEIKSGTYFSAVFTSEYPNGIAISQLKRLAEDKNFNINSAWYLKMPTNYILKSRMLSEYEVNRSLNSADKKIKKIIKVLSQRKDYLEKDSFFYNLFMNARKKYEEWNESYPEFDRGFSCSSSCTHCGICEWNCPVKNIEIGDTVSWKGSCLACLKCINICPLQAIYYGSPAEYKKQYVNPRVKVSEFR